VTVNTSNVTNSNNTVDSQLPFSVDLTNTTVDAKQKEQVIALLYHYQDCFSIDDDDIGKCNFVQHQIQTNSEKPVKQSD